MGNGIYYFEGYPIHVAGYEWDTDLSQQVLKNGIKFTQALGPAYQDAAAGAFTHGYHLAVGAGALCVLAAAVIALLGFRHPPSRHENC